MQSEKNKSMLNFNEITAITTKYINIGLPSFPLDAVR